MPYHWLSQSLPNTPRFARTPVASDPGCRTEVGTPLPSSDPAQQRTRRTAPTRTSLEVPRRPGAAGGGGGRLGSAQPQCGRRRVQRGGRSAPCRRRGRAAAPALAAGPPGAEPAGERRRDGGGRCPVLPAPSLLGAGPGGGAGGRCPAVRAPRVTAVPSARVRGHRYVARCAAPRGSSVCCFRPGDARSCTLLLRRAPRVLLPRLSARRGFELGALRRAR